MKEMFPEEQIGTEETKPAYFQAVLQVPARQGTIPDLDVSFLQDYAVAHIPYSLYSSSR